MDPRLRAAVDASVDWYEDVCALHALPTRTENGLWWTKSRPPPWHSCVKTTEPGVPVGLVLAALQGRDQGGVADSFGDLDLGPHGFSVLIDATWVHHPAVDEPPAELPGGWTVVRDTGLLAEWNQAHDYSGVLLPAVLGVPAFTVLARHHHGVLAAGAVVHRGAREGAGVVGLSNTWSAGSWKVDHSEVLAVIGALYPGAAVTDYAHGADLDAMRAVGYTSLGPQRVWLPDDR